jgi:hypothetical protein
MSPHISLADQIREVERELALRRNCYPGWVRKGTLTQAAATRQLHLMAEVLKTLQRVGGEQQQLGLFAEGGA